MNTGFHRDRADPLIVATAMPAGMRLATTDARIIGRARRTRLLPLVDPTAKALKPESTDGLPGGWSGVRLVGG